MSNLTPLEKQLRDALSSVQRTFGFMRSIIQSGEDWTKTAADEYDKACQTIDAALDAAREKDQ